MNVTEALKRFEAHIEIFEARYPLSANDAGNLDRKALAFLREKLDWSLQDEQEEAIRKDLAFKILEEEKADQSNSHKLDALFKMRQALGLSLIEAVEHYDAWIASKS